MSGGERRESKKGERRETVGPIASKQICSLIW